MTHQEEYIGEHNQLEGDARLILKKLKKAQITLKLVRQMSLWEKSSQKTHRLRKSIKE